MAIKVRIPTALRKLADGKETVDVDGANIGEVIQSIKSAYPALAEQLVDEKGSVRRFVNIFANDEDIRFLDELDTEVKDGDEVSIVPAIAGGF